MAAQVKARRVTPSVLPMASSLLKDTTKTYLDRGAPATDPTRRFGRRGHDLLTPDGPIDRLGVARRGTLRRVWTETSEQFGNGTW